MGYCTDILEIRFFNGKRTNAEDTSEDAQFYKERHAGNKRTSAQTLKKTAVNKF
jgi:hypothetical protein